MAEAIAHGDADARGDDIEQQAGCILERATNSEEYCWHVCNLLDCGLAACVLGIALGEKSEDALLNVVCDAAILRGMLQQRPQSDPYGDTRLLNINNTNYTCADYATAVRDKLFGGMTLRDMHECGLCPCEADIESVVDFCDAEDIEMASFGPLGALAVLFSDEIAARGLRVTETLHSAWTFATCDAPVVCVFGCDLTLRDMAAKHNMPMLLQACNSCVIDDCMAIYIK